MCLFKSAVIATLLYGSETWGPSAHQLKRLQAFIMWCLYAILGVFKLDQKQKTELHEMAGIERVEVLVMRRRL